MKNYTDFIKDIQNTENHLKDNTNIIIHLFEELFYDTNKFKLLLGLIKLKICIPKNAKIVVIYDTDLSFDSIAEWENLVSKLNFSNEITTENAFEILSKIALEDMFLKLSSIPLYGSNEHSFYKISKLSLLDIEAEKYNGVQIQFFDFTNLTKALKLSVKTENIEILYDKALSVLTSNEQELFGAVMAISDYQMKTIYQCLYNDSIPAYITSQIEKSPFEMKKTLASFLVSFTFSDDMIGKKCRDHFEEVFCKRKYEDADFIDIKVDRSHTLFDALFNSNKFKSKSELNRLFKQNAVKNLNGQIMTPKDMAHDCKKIRIGKHLFFNLVIQDE